MKVQSLKHPEIDWLLERPSESLYVGKKIPLWNKGYKWDVHVVLYEKPKCTGEHRVR
jgi:hypothetical protein